MSALRLRPMQSGDAEAFSGRPLPFRVKGVTGLIGETIVGYAGIGFPPDGGPPVAFAELSDSARAHKFTLHRAARQFLAAARASGIRDLTTLPDTDIEAAERWLHHLGFEKIEQGVYRWRS